MKQVVHMQPGESEHIYNETSPDDHRYHKPNIFAHKSIVMSYHEAARKSLLTIQT